MNSNPNFSACASPQRSTSAEIERDYARLSNEQCVLDLLDALPFPAMLLDGNRQAVLTNRRLAEILDSDNPRLSLGQRPGEILGCVHACENAAGCGTTETCQLCGALRAILRSMESRQRLEEECRITATKNGQPVFLDLRVSATPFEHDGTTFTFVSMADISEEKRKQALERIFFHDLMNTAGGVRSLLELMKIENDPHQVFDLVDLAHRSAERLVGEINSHRLLAAAERGQLAVRPVEIDALTVANAVVEHYRWHEVAQGRKLELDAAAEAVTIVSDQVLVERVLGNMVKNALEASARGHQVTVGCGPDGDGVKFWVHNPTVMPRDVQLQVFQRSFSTKGPGRGLGTYSMKLLAEGYLKGRVSFTTGDDAGTTFRVVLPEKLAAD